jgi:hypothetical protein
MPFKKIIQADLVNHALVFCDKRQGFRRPLLPLLDFVYQLTLAELRVEFSRSSGSDIEKRRSGGYRCHEFHD